MRSAIITLMLAGSALAQDAWTHAGRSPDRVSVVRSTVPVLSEPLWVYDAGGLFEPIVQATPVISEGGVVVVLGDIDGESHAVGLDAATGEELWRTPVVAPVLLSWSSPALTESGLAIVATRSVAVALDLSTGAEVWRTLLGQSVVNASPAIEERSGVARLTTYDPFGGGARLLTLDLGTGEILLEPTIGSASGASPALHGLRSYVALTDGSIKAFNGGDELWSTSTTPASVGFFGGTVYHGDAVYAASYGFSGGRDNSTLVKLDAATGDELWSVPSERTDAMPVPVGDGRVVLSAGLEGFGSLPTIQVYEDLGASAERLWDLATVTWDDANGDGRIDPGEYLAAGGWDHQPAVIRAAHTTMVLAGMPGGGLVLLDIDEGPSDPGFIGGSTALGGGSPAIAAGVAVSSGADHVAGFELPRSCFADFDFDGALTIFDFLAFQNAFDAGDLAADCDGDGSLTLFDFLCFQNLFDAGCA